MSAPTPVWGYIAGLQKTHLQYKGLDVTVCGIRNERPIKYDVHSYIQPGNQCPNCVRMYQDMVLSLATLNIHTKEEQ